MTPNDKATMRMAMAFRMIEEIVLEHREPKTVGVRRVTSGVEVSIAPSTYHDRDGTGFWFGKTIIDAVSKAWGGAPPDRFEQ